jgi:hypothetical protein
LGKTVAKEIKMIARAAFAAVRETAHVSADTQMGMPLDELVWPPIDPALQIDIYAGTVLPCDWNALSAGYAHKCLSSNPTGGVVATPSANMFLATSSV